MLISYKDRKEIVFHNSSVNDVQDFIDNYNPILVGYNAKYYDSYILKGVLAGFNNEELYDLNNHLISGKQGWEYDFGGYVEIPDIWDLIQDIVPMKSLKEIEGNLGMDITETTIPFNLPTKWTQKEYEEVLYYCEHDVEALIPLFEIRKGYFKTKYDLCTLAKIDYSNIGLTNAKLVAKFLGAKMVERDDERDYVMPNIIDKHYIQKEILDFFAKIWDMTIPSHKLFGGGKEVNKTKANEGMSLEIEIDGVVCVYRWGGTHSARPNYEYDDEITPEIIVINCDFASLYPHLLALPQYNFISRNIPNKDAYFNVLKNRLRLKAEGKKEEQLPLKLVLNTTYGCENNRYNDLYDPRGARGTCITGQLLLTELMNKILSIKDCHLVQTNTDGVMVSLPKESLDEYYRICNEFVKKCGIELEYDIINKISQRDVNNYCMLYGDRKKIKAKGGCFSALPDIKVKPDGLITNYKPDFKANSLSIVAEAVLKNLLFNIPVEETINNCDDLMRFQTISHLGHTYEKMVQESENGDIELHRNNRVYAGIEPSGTLIKVKHDGRRDSLANCPTNPIVDNKNEITIDKINKQWYINLAKLRVNDFKGVKRLEAYKKEELLKYCEEHNIPTDKKMKKSEIIKIVENVNAERDEKENSIKKPYKIDLTNKRYGSMVVTSFAYNKCKKSYWNCLCDCGKVFIKRQDILKNSKYMCCRECYYKLRPVLSTADKDTNNDTEYHRLYNIWTNMKRRCNVATNDRYNRYGGRGISVCEEWYKSYKTFKLWALNNGYRNDLTIDRINNDGNYEPSNCRWVTNLDQMQNTSVSWYVKYKNATYSLAMLSRVLNIPRTTLRSYLLKYNFDVEKCIKIYKERGRRK